MTASVVGLLVLRSTELIELERLASALKDHGELRPVFLIHQGSPVFVANHARFEERGVPFAVVNRQRRGTGVVRAVGWKLARWAGVDGVFGHYWSQSDQIEESVSVLRELKVSLLVVGEDGVGSDHATIAAARRLDIPVMVLPYEYSTVDQPLYYIRNSPSELNKCRVHAVAQRLLATARPQWVMDSEGEQFFRQSWERILADEWLGIAPPLPWAVHGGKAVAIAAESEVLARVYLAEGVPPAKIITTGSFALDHLRRCLDRRAECRQRLARAVGVNVAEPIVLCAFPPDSAAGVPFPGRDNVEFHSYLEMIRFWVASVKAVAPNAVFQCHPAIPASTRQEIASVAGILASGDIVELVASCDALVTTISSIIRFAVAAGFPVVNYDVYRCRFRDYREAPNVHHVESRADFQIALKLVLDHVRQRATRDWSEGMGSSNWGRLDGLGGRRILELVSRLALKI